MAKVSVLIPVYNVGKYLEQCLDSIQNQTLEDIEIICVDDGSTDESPGILDRYAARDTRICVIHKPNTGYGNSMNIALDRATGDYIAIIESDDFAERDMLMKLYGMARNQEADVVKANHYNHFADGDYFYDRLSEYPKGEAINVLRFPEILNIADTIWTCLYRREFLHSNAVRFHETPGAAYQDISFALQVWLKGAETFFIPDAVMHYRNDNPDSSMYDPYKVFCVLDEYEWLESLFCDFLKKNPKVDKYFVASKYRDYINHYHRVAMQYQYALLVKIASSLGNDIREGRILEKAFKPGVWEKANKIHTDMNAFYMGSAKEWKDLRMQFCRYGNEELYGKGFIHEVFNFPRVVIYGAGRVGQRLAGKMLEMGVRPDCFAVTEIKGNETECMGIPIRKLGDISGWAAFCAVIVAVAEGIQYELYKNLVQYGFKNIFRVDAVVGRMLERD